MNDTDPKAELERISGELLERLATELARPPETRETTLVGGIAKIGSKLEQLMGAALLYIADVSGEPVEVLLQAVARDGKGSSFRRATLGPLALAVRAGLKRPKLSVRDRLLSSVSRDLDRKRSSILWFVNRRNEAIHGGSIPRGAREAICDLERVVRELREDAGW